MDKRPALHGVFVLYVLFLISLALEPGAHIALSQTLLFMVGSTFFAISILSLLTDAPDPDLGPEETTAEALPEEQVAVLMDRAQLYEMWPELDPERSGLSEPVEEPPAPEEPAARFHDFTGRSAPEALFDERGWGPVVPAKGLGRFVH